MKLAALAFALCALVAPQNSGTPTASGIRWRVSVEDDDGDLLCTVHADQDSLLDVLREIARQSNLSLDGVEASWSKTLVSADLERRPLRQVLNFVLGSVGLRGELRQGAIYLREGEENLAVADELYESALASYLRTLRDFPNHSLADDALRSQARIEERRGHVSAARAHYEALIERQPDSDLVPEAMYKSGVLSMREGAWQDAAQRLSDLLRLEVDHDYEAPGRLELAYCVAELGEYERALYMIDALEGIAPPQTPEEERRRAYVRIRAMAGLGQGKQALALLDDVDRRLGFANSKRESLALRAAAAEAAGQLEESARAWLAYGRIAEGAERVRAVTRAARMAADGGDELTALFIIQLAKREGVELTDLSREVRQRLALDEMELSTTTVQRLARAERQFTATQTADALKTLQSIEPLVPQLSAEDRLRFAKVHARTLAAELGVDAGVSSLRSTLPSFDDASARRELYLLAGDLLEQEGRLDDAIEAYQGRL